MKNKIYFSKSNAVPKETVDKIRRYILRFDVDLKEFSGGTYSNSAMDDCEFLIVLPPSLPKKKPGVSEVASVGRGIFQQTQYFYNRKGKINNILLITAYGLCDNKDIAYVEFSTPDYWNITNETNYVNYGDIHLQRRNSSMIEHFNMKESVATIDDIFDPSDTDKPTTRWHKWDECDSIIQKDIITYSKNKDPQWDDIYSEWFTEPIKKKEKLETVDLIINPEDPDDYSLLLTL